MLSLHPEQGLVFFHKIEKPFVQLIKTLIKTGILPKATYIADPFHIIIEPAAYLYPVLLFCPGFDLDVLGVFLEIRLD